jgi:hypothetical protein
MDVSSDEKVSSRRALEHLLPEESPFCINAASAHYYRSVAALLIGNKREKRFANASVICLPSFEPEWAVHLYGSEIIGFRLICSEPSSLIAHTSDTSSITVLEREVFIAADMANVISETWRIVLTHTRHSSDHNCGRDGVSYHFASKQMAGRIWTPPATTVPGKLVDLSHALRDFVRATESERVQLRECIIHQASSLGPIAEQLATADNPREGRRVES